MIGLVDVTKAKCNLSEYARLCRYHDWSACMSDSFAVYRRGESNRKLLASVADTSQNHKISHKRFQMKNRRAAD